MGAECYTRGDAVGREAPGSRAPRCWGGGSSVTRGADCHPRVGAGFRATSSFGSRGRLREADVQGCHHDQPNIDALRALEDRGRCLVTRAFVRA